MVEQSQCDVVIVGAGLAGLCAAWEIQCNGLSVVVVEASDSVGGRVRTDIVDGFQLDRGFQVMLTAYPELQSQVDMRALDLRPFDPGALVWRNGKGHVVSDPFRKPKTLLATTVAPIGTVLDKARIVALRARVLRKKSAVSPPMVNQPFSVPPYQPSELQVQNMERLLELILEVATKELTETELRLLQAQTAVEWAEAQVVECQKRIKRLRSYINAETGDTK